jgi:predicted nucleic acid-binding Zn ribbon protein
MPETPHHVAQERSGSVRTLEGLSCPVCRIVPLRGRQTVCSPRCRAKRHRQRREDGRQAQIQDVQSLLHAALMKLENAR